MSRFLLYVRKQWNGRANSELIGMIDDLLSCYEYWGNCEEGMDYQKQLASCLSMIQEAMDAKDLILVADLLELQLIPILLSFQEGLMLQNQQKPLSIQNKLEEAGWRIEYTATGDETLCAKDEQKGTSFYLHSNNNPYGEAYQWAIDLLQEGKDHLILYGAGLGFGVEALLIVDAYVTIDIYEANSLAYQLLQEVLKRGTHIFEYRDW